MMVHSTSHNKPVLTLFDPGIGLDSPSKTARDYRLTSFSLQGRVRSRTAPFPSWCEMKTESLNRQLQENCRQNKPAQLAAFLSKAKSSNDFWLTMAQLPQRRQRG